MCNPLEFNLQQVRWKLRDLRFSRRWRFRSSSYELWRRLVLW